MNWEIVAGIIALATFIISIGKIVHNNTEALTALKIELQGLKSSSEKQDTKIEQIDNQVQGHETRITILETPKKK